MKAAYLSVLLALLGACASVPSPRLLDQLGGEAGLRRLVSALIVEIQADPRISALFAETEFDYFGDRLFEELCVTADGTCEYTGLPLEEAHSGMTISEAEFNWFVEDAQRAMSKIGLPLATQNRLLARLAAQREAVIRQ